MNDEKKKIKVVLADDHPILMAGFSMVLGQYDIEVIGEATSPDAAQKMFSELLPDVLVLDIRFGDHLSGLDTAKQILLKFPSAAIVFLSQFDQDGLIKEAYKIGGRAFITKDCAPVDLATAISNAHAGKLFFLPHIANRLAKLSVRGDNSPQSLLNERELELFLLMAQGLTIAEMADNLSLSQKTVSNLGQTIKAKLEVTRSADITLLAVKHRLISIED